MIVWDFGGMRHDHRCTLWADRGWNNYCSSGKKASRYNFRSSICLFANIFPQRPRCQTPTSGRLGF